MPMAASTLGGDGGGLGGLEDAGVLAGEQEGGGGAGLAGAGGLGGGGGEVGEDELGGAGAQVAAVGGAAAGLAGLDAGFFQLAGGTAPVRAPLVGEADTGVGGVGALVDQGAPGDRVALAVGAAGGVAVAGVGVQQVAVDLDDRDVAQVAGGAAQARPGGAGDRDRAAGDRGDLGGHGGREGFPVAGGGGEPGGGWGGGGWGGGGHGGRSFPGSRGGG